MATGSISSLGVGSGIDLNSLLTQLVNLERQPIQQIQTRSASFTTKLSALGNLKSALSNLQTAAKTLNTTANFGAFKTAVGDTTVASATATSSAAAGSYSVEVQNLAEFQKIKTTTGLASASSTIATGTLTLQVGAMVGGVFTADGTKTKNIVIDGSNNTLTGLRDAINASGAEVSASIVNTGNGATPFQLVLTSKNSGTANSFQMSGLAGYDFDPANVGGSTLASIQAAEDAIVVVDTIQITKSTNSISDAIEGVTLNLLKTNVGTPTTLTVTTDAKAVEDKISAFIKSYNDVVSQIKTQTAYDATTKKAGTLNGDSSVRSIQTQLRNLVGSSLSGGGMTRLSDVGIKIAVDGTLSLDSTKFQAVLADPTKNVAAVFASVNGVSGFADQINTRITDFLSTEGVLTSRTDGISKTIKDFETRMEAMNKRLEAVEARYRRQFSALDTAISGFNATSTYLTQQLAALSNNFR